MKAADIKNHIQILTRIIPFASDDVKEALFTAIGCMSVTYKEFLKMEKKESKNAR